MGTPNFEGKDDLPTFQQLQSSTFVSFADMDASPTKAWLVSRFGDAQWQWHYDYAFGKRSGEELYDLRNDPDQTRNVAADPLFIKEKNTLSAQLMSVLKEAKDPRVAGDGGTFDRPPYSDPQADPPARKRPNQAR